MPKKIPAKTSEESAHTKEKPNPFLKPNKPNDKVTADEFIKEFKPYKNCKECQGRGYLIMIEGHRGESTPILRKGLRRMRFCHCVLKQYWASGKKYDIIEPEEKPKEKEKDASVPLQP